MRVPYEQSAQQIDWLTTLGNRIENPTLGLPVDVAVRPSGVEGEIVTEIFVRERDFLETLQGYRRGGGRPYQSLTELFDLRDMARGADRELAKRYGEVGLPYESFGFFYNQPAQPAPVGFIQRAVDRFHRWP